MSKDEVSITVLFDQSFNKATYNLTSGHLDFSISDPQELCQGFGNDVNVDGKKTFVALFSHEDKLYLLCNNLYELNHNEYRAESKSRFFKPDQVSFYQCDSLKFIAETRLGSFDGDVIETLYHLFKTEHSDGSKIQHLIRFYQEKDPVKKRMIDKRD